MVVAKKFVLRRKFDGTPKPEDVVIVEEQLAPLKDGEFLAQAVYLSVDPYIRYIAESLEPGDTLVGTQLAQIIESKAKEYPVGEYVIGSFGWKTYSIASHHPPHYLGFPSPMLAPNIGDLPLSLTLGALGLTGNTAYFGFLEICRPKEGEVVVVTAAAGAVGSHVGQIAKLKGCYVIGVTGSDEKGRALLEQFGFDEFINYKKPGFAKTLSVVAPQGIDCYFDNVTKKVGGQVSSIILQQMNPFGRVAVCGSISTYNEVPENPSIAPSIQSSVVIQQLKVKGFIVNRWLDRWQEGINQNIEWIRDGSLVCKETITEGFENTFDAFVNMLQGKNIGKAVVKL